MYLAPRIVIGVLGLTLLATGCSPSPGKALLVTVDSAESLAVASLAATITAGSRTKTFTMQLATPGIPPARTFGIDLSSGAHGALTIVVRALAANGTTLAGGTQTVTIADDRTPSITVSLSTTTIPDDLGLDLPRAGDASSSSDGGSITDDLTSSTDGGTSSDDGAVVTPLTVTPTTAALRVGRAHVFVASEPVTWSVATGSGTIDATGTYVAPFAAGTYTLTATAVADITRQATATITVAASQLNVLAGHPGGDGNVDGAGNAARFAAPNGLAIDASGNLYVADENNNSIRKIAPGTAAVTTIAGGSAAAWQDGVGTAAQFKAPKGVAADGNTALYVADTGNDVIRRIDLTTLEVTTLAGDPGTCAFADGTGGLANFCLPHGMVIDGGALYVADRNNGKIRKVTLPGALVSTVADVSSPEFVTTNGAGTLYTGSDNGNAIYKTVLSGPTTTTLASGDFNGVTFDGSSIYTTGDDTNILQSVGTGASPPTTFLAGSTTETGSLDGVGSAARFWIPMGIIAAGGGVYYVSDYFNATIRKMAITTGPTVTISTYAGAADASGFVNDVGIKARFYVTGALATDSAGNAYVVDRANQAIRKIVLATGVVSTVVAAPTIGTPQAIAVDGPGNTIYFTQANSSVIRRCDLNGSNVADFFTPSPFQYGIGLVLDGTTLYAVDDNGYIHAVTGLSGTPSSTIVTYQGGDTTALAGDGAGHLFGVSETYHIVYEIDVASGTRTVIGGKYNTYGYVDGPVASTLFYQPRGVAYDPTNDTVLVSDGQNRVVRQISRASGVVTTAFGTRNVFGYKAGPLPASLGYPANILRLSDGTLLISDGENIVVKVD